MAEFGENLKRVREEKGITQQTLADYLYVTRQAVSRWEGGSRYPDLLTAKKLAQYLEVSLDDLLSDEDMKLYVEKNAILESPVAKRAQIMLMALACMCYLVNCYFYLSNYFIQDGLTIRSNNITKCILLTMVLGYGVYVALYDKLSPKVTTLIYTLYYGVAILAGVISIVSKDSGFTIPAILGDMACAITFLVICIRFFLSKKCVSPVWIYVVAGIDGVLGIGSFLGGLMSDIPNEIYRDVFMLHSLYLMEKMLLLVLMVVMAYTLDKKRKLAVR